MVGFRVTKYDPGLRLTTGAYAKDEWTSATDIGRSFGGRAVAVSDYIRVENSYVRAVQIFLEWSGLRHLTVADLQINEIDGNSFPLELAQETIERARSPANDAEVSGDELDWLVRLSLREAIWCRLIGTSGFYVHFGYDYYMYIGAEAPGDIAPHMPEGIFAEIFSSPFNPDISDGEEL
jgi:hypothetical protein